MAEVLISWLSCPAMCVQRACLLLKYLGQDSGILFFFIPHPKNNTCDLADNDNFLFQKQYILPGLACYCHWWLQWCLYCIEQGWTVNLLLAVLYQALFLQFLNCLLILDLTSWLLVGISAGQSQTASLASCGHCLSMFPFVQKACGCDVCFNLLLLGDWESCRHLG